MEPVEQSDALADRPANFLRAIEKGVAYLEQHQFANGEFCCYIATDDTMQGWCAVDSTVFPTILIANSMLSLVNQPDMPSVDAILSGSTKFLLEQVLPGGGWNHFTRLHPYSKLCPPDVDDTVCASAVLRACGITFPYPQNVPLILATRNKQGLFYSWFIFRPQWQTNRDYLRLASYELRVPIKSLFFWLSVEASRNDIDGVVNANVLYYLGEHETTQPIIDYLLRIIAEHKEGDCDKWYRNVMTVYYYISRNYYAGVTKLEPARQSVIDRILAMARPDGQIGESELDTALAICTLLNWRSNPPELKRGIDFLLRTQHPVGEWARWGFYHGGPKKLQCWGSEELTTAFCVEALARYYQLTFRNSESLA